MDEKRFWDIISVGCPHDAASPDWGEWHEGLHRELSRLDPEDLVRFDRLFEQKAPASAAPGRPLLA